MNRLPTQDLERYSIIWTVTSAYGMFLGAMYRNIVGNQEKNFGSLLEVETTIFVIYKISQYISQNEEDETVLKFQELSSNSLIAENKSLFSHLSAPEAISFRISEYKKSQNDFEVLFLTLGNTENQSKFNNSYGFRLSNDIMGMVNKERNFLFNYSSLVNENIKPSFDNLYRDGQSFMQLSPEEMSNRLTINTNPPKSNSRPEVNYSTKQDVQKKEGCYIATAVYGSYNHDKVLVLRKFRDDILQPTMIGRFAVCIYYFLSPTLSLYFKEGLLNRITRIILDKIIKKIEC